MQQELAITDGGMILAVAVGVLADVRVHQPRLIADYGGVGFL
jgi:hypothetical protein